MKEFLNPHSRTWDRRAISLGRFRIPIPNARGPRITLGIALCLGGLLGFLPVFGFWMIPLGLAVLSVDLPVARRLRRRIEIAWRRPRKKKVSR